MKLVYKWRQHWLHKKIMSCSLANNFSPDFTQMCSPDSEKDSGLNQNITSCRQMELKTPTNCGLLEACV